MTFLRQASLARPTRPFTSQVFGGPWDAFVERWAPVVHAFVEGALGPYGTEPGQNILPLDDADHASGATASFQPGSGQVRLSTVTAGLPGMTLEKLTHEMIHGSLSQFPEGDPFYEEGFVDFSTWLLAHAPVWGEHRQSMIDAAAYNIGQRRDRAMKGVSDYDRKRWAGGTYAMLAHGPWLIARLKMKKAELDFTW